jgi:hypothetical protein
MAKITKKPPAGARPETTADLAPKSPRIAKQIRPRTEGKASSLASDARRQPSRKAKGPSVGGTRSDRSGDIVEPARMQASPCSVIVNNATARGNDRIDLENAAVIVDDQIEEGFEQFAQGLEAIARSFSLFSGGIGSRRRLALLEPVVTPTKALLNWAFQIDSSLGLSPKGQGPEGQFLEAIYALCGKVRRIELLCQEAKNALIVPASRQIRGAKP